MDRGRGGAAEDPLEVAVIWIEEGEGLPAVIWMYGVMCD